MCKYISKQETIRDVKCLNVNRMTGGVAYAILLTMPS